MITINQRLVKIGKFPNNEIHIDSEVINMSQLDDKPTRIKLTYESSDDLIALMMIKKHIDNTGDDKKIRLVMNYMPYSRMDRHNDDYVFSLKYVTEFINNLSFYSVLVNEPHSEVTTALLNNVVIFSDVEDYLDKCLKDIDFDYDKDFLFFPDAGAQKRYAHMTGHRTLVGHKNRNFKTGEITSLSIHGTFSTDSMTKFEDRPKVIIVDDLCSRGGTFMFAAAELHKVMLGKVYMVVGHCEQNIFNGDILKDDSPIEKVFTTNSMVRDSHPKIINMEEL